MDNLNKKCSRCNRLDDKYIPKYNNSICDICIEEKKKAYNLKKSMLKKCIGLKRSGEICNCTVINNTDYCGRHINKLSNEDYIKHKNEYNKKYYIDHKIKSNDSKPVGRPSKNYTIEEKRELNRLKKQRQRANKKLREQEEKQKE